MKKICAFLSIIFIMLTVSCEDLSINFIGKIQVSPNVASNGDIVTLYITSSNMAGPNHVNETGGIKFIEYYLEGVKIAESTLKSESWKATFQIEDITPGSYLITAHCVPKSSSTEVKEMISYGILHIN